MLTIFSSMTNEELAARINDLLNERGWTQRTLEERAGLASGYISPLLSGKMRSQPKPVTLRRIADALNVSVSQLTGEETPRERAIRIAEEARDYGFAEPRSEEAAPVTPRPGSETLQQVIRRHFPNATPEQFADIERQVALRGRRGNRPHAPGGLAVSQHGGTLRQVDR